MISVAGSFPIVIRIITFFDGILSLYAILGWIAMNGEPSKCELIELYISYRKYWNRTQLHRLQHQNRPTLSGVLCEYVINLGDFY